VVKLQGHRETVCSTQQLNQSSPDGEIETFITERFGPDHATGGEET
jgi:hypothetical protein